MVDVLWMNSGCVGVWVRWSAVDVLWMCCGCAVDVWRTCGGHVPAPPLASDLTCITANDQIARLCHKGGHMPDTAVHDYVDSLHRNTAA